MFVSEVLMSDAQETMEALETLQAQSRPGLLASGSENDLESHLDIDLDGDADAGETATPSDLSRVPPYSDDAEQAVLGGLLLEPEALAHVADLLSASAFYRKPHRLIYQAILALFDRGDPVDIVTVSEWLNDRGELERVGGRDLINHLALSVVTTANIGYYAQIVADKALLRKLIKVGGQITQAAFEEDDAETALDKAQQALFQIVQQNTVSDLMHIRDILPTSFTQIEERHQNKGTLMGTPTDFYDLDTYLSGLHPSDLIILAARPSMGKTAFSLNLATNVAIKAQKPVLIFSLEMSKEQMVSRMLCSVAEIDAQRIRTGEITEMDFHRLRKAMCELGEAQIYIDDSAGLTVMDLRARARKMMMESASTHGTEGIGLIVIDYLQLMEGRSGGGGDNRVQEISAISRGLKSLARELKVPVIALSQLSRAVESRQDKRPMLSDLRESGAIEQDADVVMFIYRDEYYNPESPTPGVADIIIAKQRNGPVGTVSLLFRNSITKFLNPADSQNRVF
ncbi:MAG: replicative DNA helicase [Vampirovibrionales bacterium]|nr:replicative DNA helicase [Vampirovibrionales bacterium]